MAAIELSSLDGFKQGDKAVISDPRTQNEFGVDRVEFTVKSVRTYISDKEDVKLTGYLLGGLTMDEEAESCMLAIKEGGGFYSIYLYFLENGGVNDAFSENEEGEDEDEEKSTVQYGNLVYPEENEYVDMVVVLNNFGKLMKEIRWIKKGLSEVSLSYHEDDRGRVDEGSFCEYFTEDDNYGNDLALVTCQGKMEDGKLEMWQGYAIQDREVELFDRDDK